MQHLQWTGKTEGALLKIKNELVFAPVLCFQIFLSCYTDANDVAVDGNLTEEIDGSEKVIAYASRSLSRSEKYYSVQEREWSSNLNTDHSSLVRLQNIKNVSDWLAHWIKLRQYNFDLVYKGSDNVVPDFLSRTTLENKTPPALSDSDDNQFDIFLIDIVTVDSDKW